jgi:hypothetical protein
VKSRRTRKIISRLPVSKSFTYRLRYTNDGNKANDYVAFWRTRHVGPLYLGFGLKLGFDKSVDALLQGFGYNDIKNL